MSRNWFGRVATMAALGLTLTAILQELEKPKEQRKWHGKVACLVPYDFRPPSIERFKESYWNQYDSHIITREAFGVGWGVNLYALLERLRLIRETYISEEDFLMPTRTMKDLLSQRKAQDGTEPA